jgi:hypothetical protein
MQRSLCNASRRWVMGTILLAAPALAAQEARIDFNRDIRPILSNNCFKCHGFDDKTRQANLRLDTRDGGTTRLMSGNRAVVPGKSGESALMTRVTASDEKDRMPPVSTGKILTPQQIELLRRWIDQGAEWREHWSFIPPQRPAPPAVKHEPLVRNPIDRFVLARLAAAGIEPSPPADRVTLIRRVTYDLTGLPPTPAEVDAFLADESPPAYERLVERLLASPRYGEHMARYWLDAARYGDTHGLHLDNERSMWPYRDWVIEAFNRNLPFDQFTIEQLAGDLLPAATRDQHVASGFNRCNVTTSEGGSIDDEVLVRYAVDRVETTGTVWLGLTLGCAVCHNHKFDPVSQTEFYRLYSFFGSAADRAMDGNALLPPPTLKLPTAEQTARLKWFDDQVAVSQKNIQTLLAKLRYDEPAAPDAGPSEPREFVWIDDSLPSNAVAQGDTAWKFVTPPSPVYSGERASTRTAPGLSQHFFTGAQPGLALGEGDRLFAYCYLDAQNPPKEIMLQFNDGTWEHRAYWGEDAIAWGAANTPGRVAMGPLPELGKWVRLEVPADKVGLKPDSMLNGWAFTQFAGTVYWDKAGIVTRTPQQGDGFDSQIAWEAYERSRSKSSVPAPVRDAIKVEPAKRNDDQKRLVRDYFLEHIYTRTRALFGPPHAQTELMTKQRSELDATIPSTLVMAEMPQPRETFVLIRGAYNKKGEKVTAGVPAILPPLPMDAPPNRLGLARWLVDPGHPLTARVTVNRFWQQCFGHGLVRTANDFGAQGEPPTHPDLLDWLASEFVAPTVASAKPWDVKHLMRLMVTSYTYRQASRVTPELQRRDPENGLLARGPRFRMDAEVVRDMALATSGLLADKIGGKSVKPYQPPGLWEAVGFVGSNTREFRGESGEALYRRSMYTFWKRTCPPPSLVTFDAPSRETCTVRRARTNTPLQALVLMNDEQYVEAARHLARRMIVEGGSQPHDRLAYGFRLTTARRPETREMDVMLSLFNQQLAHYKTEKEAAVKLLSVGESKRDEALEPTEYAAWTMMANLLLNLDETVTKE